jgi:hypothetical protein
MSIAPWQCTVCGQWVYGGIHTCGGGGALGNLPGSVSIPPCRAPWNPLTADAVRLIVREELERAGVGKSAITE